MRAFRSPPKPPADRRLRTDVQELVELIRRHHGLKAPTALDVLKEAMEDHGELTETIAVTPRERSGSARGLNLDPARCDSPIGRTIPARRNAKPDRRSEAMIVRTWRGAVRRADRDSYAEYLQGTGVAGYASTPGNRGVHMLRRDLGETTEFVMLTFWDCLDSVCAFAGDDVETAVFYPKDDRFLVERDLTATHYEVVGPAE